MSATNARYRTVVVPAYGPFDEERLIEGIVVVDGEFKTTGLCRTIEEAQDRAARLTDGAFMTQAPGYQANQEEMDSVWSQEVGIRDGGLCRAAIEDAIKAGLHTVAWAIASRYLVAGWV